MFKKNLISERLRELRESKNLTRPQLSQKTGISESTLKSWELSYNHSPNINQLSKLANYYNVSLDYLACRTDEPINPEVNKETPKDNSKINK